MLTLVHTFIRTINEREHVLQLTRQSDFAVMLVCGAQRIPIGFKERIVSIQESNCNIEYELCGDLTAFKDLLEGKKTLRYLIRQNRIKITAPFRTILLLESIFYLTKINDHLQKII